MQVPGAAPPPPGVFFDSAFDGIGDLLALALLYGLSHKGEMRMTAVSVSRPDFAAAQFCDVMQHFYGGGGSFPIGLAAGEQKPLPVYAGLLAKAGGDGAPVYKPVLRSYNNTGDPATILRNALTASEPQNAIVIASGALTTLARLLALRGSKELIALNVRRLAIAAGPWIATDEKAAQRVFDDWPTPIYACSAELGDAVRFPAASMEGGSKPNPLADAYRAFAPSTVKGVLYDAPTSAMDAALYAVRPNAGYFKLSGAGVFRAGGAGMEFTPSAQGKRQLLLPDEAQIGVVTKVLTELAGAQPMGRGHRLAGDAPALPEVVFQVLHNSGG